MQSKQEKDRFGKLGIFLRRFRTEDIFWETEKNSNMLVAYGMLVVAFFLIVVVLMTYVSQLDYDFNEVVRNVVVGVAILLPFSLYCFHVRGNKRWLKYVLILNATLAIMYLSIITSYLFVLLIAVPVAMSTRYYSVGFTRATAVVTGILYALTIWATIYFDLPTEYDLNYIAMPAGAVFSISENEWLIDRVMEIGIDKAETLHNMLFLAVPSRLLELAVISAICVAVARRGRKMVLQEVAASAERASIETELALASKIQLSELPCTFPAFPTHPAVDLYAMMHPAKEVGGDYYDFFELDSDRVAFLVADVSGKGVPGALFMMRGKALMKNYLREKSTPAEAMTEANAHLSARNEENLFITAWVGVLEVSTGKLTYVNAGHCRPLLRRRGEVEFTFLEPLHDLPLACYDDTKYDQSEVQLHAGDALFLYTDGVTEAANLSEEMYGAARMTAFLNEYGNSPLQELLPALRKDVDAFVGEAKQFDDITMLMLRLKDEA